MEIPKATIASTITWDVSNGWGDYLLDGPSHRGIVNTSPSYPNISDIGFYMNTNNVGINGVLTNSPNGTMLTNIYKGLDGFYRAFGWTNMVGMCSNNQISASIYIGTQPDYWTVNNLPVDPTGNSDTEMLETIKHEIDHDRTVLGCFKYWNLINESPIINISSSSETDLRYYDFSGSLVSNPHTLENYEFNSENHDAALGHTVCIIGYINQNTTGDISGNTDWLIVRDNQPHTHRNELFLTTFHC